MPLLHRIGGRVDQLDPLKIFRQVGGCPLRTTADGAIPIDLEFLHRHRQHDGLTTVIHHIQSGRGLQVAGRIDLQIPHAGIGLAPLGILHGNPARPIHRHVQIPSGGHQHAMLQVLAWALSHGKDPAWQALSERLHASGLLEIGLETGGIGIGEVVAANSQAVHGLFGPRHGDIKQVIHGILRQTDDSDRRNAIRVPTAEIWGGEVGWE